MYPRLVQVRPWDLPRVPGEHLQEDNGSRPEVRGADGETQRADLPFRRVPHQKPGPAEAMGASRHFPLCYRVRRRVCMCTSMWNELREKSDRAATCDAV